MTTQIQETTKYEIFTQYPINRNVSRTRALEQSMRQHGFLDAYPLHVIANGDGRYRVKSGHHRLYVARKLGIPVKYVVSDDDITIHELEAASNKWSVQDFVDSYARAGHPAYLEIVRMNKRTGISANMCASLFAGEKAGSGNQIAKIKRGEFKIKNAKFAADVENIVMHCKDIGIECAAHRYFISAISKVMLVPELSADRLKKKFKAHKALVERQPTVDDYLKMIDAVYNRQSSDKLPLAFRANEVARERQEFFGRKKS